jgi:hypothetical protein
MSTSVSTAFVTAYTADVKHVFQREGSLLRPGVQMKNGVVGSSAVFQKIGSGTATTKARHGTITPMNQTHTAPSATLADFYAGDWSDMLDESKITINERMALARGGAYALGRKVDDQIITALNGTSQSTIAVTVTSYATIQSTMLQWVEALDANDVPNDGMRYGLITPRLWSQLMTVEEFQRADFIGANGLPLIEGAPIMQRWKLWNGVMWKVHNALPNAAAASATGYIWHRDAVGYATGAHANNSAANDMVAADITWHGDRASWFVNHMMSGGAVLIDDTGVIEALWDDSAAIVTS